VKCHGSFSEDFWERDLLALRRQTLEEILFHLRELQYVTEAWNCSTILPASGNWFKINPTNKKTKPELPCMIE